MGFRTHHRLLDRLLPPLLQRRSTRPGPLPRWGLAVGRLCHRSGLLGPLRRLPGNRSSLAPGRLQLIGRRFRRGRPPGPDRSLRLRPGPGNPAWVRSGRGRPPELLRLVPF